MNVLSQGDKQKKVRKARQLKKIITSGIKFIYQKNKIRPN